MIASVKLNPDGALVSEDLGPSLLSDLIDEDLVGHSWWLDGQMIDASECAVEDARF